MSSNIKQDTSQLIESLSDDLTKIKPMAHPLKRAIPWVILTVIYIISVVYYLGIRGDFASKLHDPIYVFELSHALAISISAVICSLWLCVPDMREQKWMIAVPLSLFATFIVWVLLKSTLDMHKTFTLDWGHCHEDSILFGVVPALAILFISIKGRTTHPNLISLMSAISVGGLGYMGLRITCASDDIGHLCVYHILPYLLLGLLVTIFAKRIYRW